MSFCHNKVTVKGDNLYKDVHSVASKSFLGHLGRLLGHISCKEMIRAHICCSLVVMFFLAPDQLRDLLICIYNGLIVLIMQITIIWILC